MSARIAAFKGNLKMGKLDTGECEAMVPAGPAFSLMRWHEDAAAMAASRADMCRCPERRLRLLAEERMHRDSLELARLHHQDLQPATLDSSILADHRYG